MAGVKGMKGGGGARPNTGGARPNSGPKPKPPVLVDTPPAADPKEVLTLLMNSPALDVKLRIEAAKALMPFVHKKHADTGKKEQAEAAAKKASTGRFAPQVIPTKFPRTP